MVRNLHKVILLLLNTSLDEPTAGNRNRTSSTRSRFFPSISGRFPMMEGYAFITLDSHFSDMGGHRSVHIETERERTQCIKPV